MFDKLKQLIHTVRKRLRINRVTNRRTSTTHEKRYMERENFVQTSTGIVRTASESDDLGGEREEGSGKGKGQGQKRRPALIPADADLNEEDEAEIRARTGGVLVKMEDGDVRNMAEMVMDEQRRDAENGDGTGDDARNGQENLKGYGYAYGYGIGGGEPYVYPQRRKRKACEAMEDQEEHQVVRNDVGVGRSEMKDSIMQG